MSPVIHVAVGVLIDDQHCVLLARRVKGTHLEGFWEFPGGKVEPNENFHEALSREIQEELNIQINVLEKIAEEKYIDDEIDIILHYYLCSEKSGTIRLNEHENIAWIEKEDFDKYAFVEGDGNVLSLL